MLPRQCTQNLVTLPQIVSWVITLEPYIWRSPYFLISLNSLIKFICVSKHNHVLHFFKHGHPDLVSGLPGSLELTSQGDGTTKTLQIHVGAVCKTTHTWMSSVGVDLVSGLPGSLELTSQGDGTTKTLQIHVPAVFSYWKLILNTDPEAEINRKHTSGHLDFFPSWTILVEFSGFYAIYNRKFSRMLYFLRVNSSFGSESTLDLDIMDLDLLVFWDCHDDDISVSEPLLLFCKIILLNCQPGAGIDCLHLLV